MVEFPIVKLPDIEAWWKDRGEGPRYVLASEFFENPNRLGTVDRALLAFLVTDEGLINPYLDWARTLAVDDERELLDRLRGVMSFNFSPGSLHEAYQYGVFRYLIMAQGQMRAVAKHPFYTSDIAQLGGYAPSEAPDDFVALWNQHRPGKPLPNTTR